MALSRGAVGLSAVWDCSISCSYSLTIINEGKMSLSLDDQDCLISSHVIKSCR